MLSRLLLLLFLLFILSGVYPSPTFRIINKCRRTVWPGLLSGSGSPQLYLTGFRLGPHESRTVTVPANWSGRIWGRTSCSRNPSTGRFECATGDCGSGEIGCQGGGAQPPATLAELTLDGADGLDFYDVSLVDGYNLPMVMYPVKVEAGRCAATGCLVELNGACPMAMSVRGLACRSACEAFGNPEFCCSGEFASPATCSPSSFSLFFKHACPRAYSYAYDDNTSTYTCHAANYVIMFCPPPYSSHRVLGLRKDGALVPLLNKTTMYLSSRYTTKSAYTGMILRN